MNRFKALYRLANHPYVLLAFAAIIAYLPVSSMAYALKNDIISIEFPIKYFLSECLRNRVSPFWFNTWAMGFPLESILTWSVFNPLQFLFSLCFRYNIYMLHLEFIFYIVLSGISMYYFLEKHISKNSKTVWVLSCCYMLSGFNVGSSQWLLYITASSFLPLAISFLMDLLKNPSWKSSLLFTAVFYMMITGVYAAFSIINCYILAGIALIGLVNPIFLKGNRQTKKTLVFLVISFLSILLISLPSILSSIEVLSHIRRGNPINSSFLSNADYLDPKGLLSLLLPLSSVRLSAMNTEATMMHAYIGIVPLLLFPLSILTNWAAKRKNFFLLGIALLFLLISFGSTTPLRGWLNLFPGFSYFRHPGLFRLYFIFFFIVYITKTFRTPYLSNLPQQKFLYSLLIGLAACFLILAIKNYHSIDFPSTPTVAKKYIQSLSFTNAIFISACIQAIIILLMAMSLLRKKSTMFFFIAALDLVINTFICTPFFTVSSYSTRHVSEILQLNSVKKFPTQTLPLITVPPAARIESAVWYNINVYRKEISSVKSYWGPLTLKNFDARDAKDVSYYNNLPLFTKVRKGAKVEVIEQKPDYLFASIKTDNPMNVFFLQNYYPGWHAYFNKKEIAILQAKTGGMQVNVPSGGSLEFRYEKQSLLAVAIAINILVLSIIAVFCCKKIRRYLKQWSY